MPDSPHLEHSWCGYTLLSLKGWTKVPAEAVTRVTLNGREHKFRPTRQRTLMLVPAIQQEAQVLSIYFLAAAEPPKPFGKVRLGLAPPVLSMGFTPDSRPLGRGH